MSPDLRQMTLPWGSLHIILFSGLAATVLTLGVNSYDSGLLKGPILVLTASLLIMATLLAAIRQGGIAVRRNAADPLVACFALLSLVGVFLSPVRSLAHQALFQTLSCTVLFFAGSILFDTKAHFQSLLRLLTWLFGIVAVFGLLQYFLADRLFLEFYLGPERRIGSTLGSPAFLGGILVLVIPVLCSTALARDQPAKTRFLQGGLVVTLLLNLALTRSRSSIIACVLALGMLLLLRSRPIRLQTLLLISGALLAGAILAWSGGALNTGPGSTLARRTFFWEAGARAFLASPFWGHGTGSFEPEMIRFRSPDYWTVGSEDIVPHAHNEVIEIAAESGLIGLALAGWLIWIVLRSAIRQSSDGEGWRRSAAAGLLCGLAGLVVDNLANVSLRQAPVAALAWLFMGIVLSPALRSERSASGTIAVRVSGWAGWILMAVCSGFLLWYIPGEVRRFSADQHTIKALLSVGQGDHSQAATEYQRALELNPASFLARSCLSSELLKLQRPSEALAEARALLSAYPDYPKAWMVSAVALYSDGRIQEASDAIKRELHLRDHPEAFYVEAMILRAAGDTLAERKALESLLTRCLAGGVLVQGEYATSRLRELSTSRADLQQLRPLFELLFAAFPADQSVRTSLLLVKTQLGNSAASPPSPP